MANENSAGIQTPEVILSNSDLDTTQWVVTFKPPVASWSFTEEGARDELWKELHQATSALLYNAEDSTKFSAETAESIITRIKQVLLAWKRTARVTYDLRNP